MATMVAITGKGIISAIGADEEQVYSSIKNGASGIGAIKYLDTIHNELPCGEVKMSNTELKSALGINTNQMISRTVLMTIYSIRQAIKQAKISDAELHAQRVVLVMGTTVGGMDLTEKYWSTIDSNPESQKCILQHETGSCTELAASYFDYIDDSTTISTACSSAANAILIGAEMLKTGKADIVIAGGSEALTKFHLNGFNSLMILDQKICRPFDDTRSGLNLGEGAAFVIMETKQHADNRHAHIQAYLSGYANNCDAFHQTASSPNGEGAFLAMTNALKSANLSPRDIHYINAHGTGTPNNDLSESKAVERVFGNEIPPISSTKPLTGHTTSASGAIEAFICILALSKGFIPGNLGWKSSNDGCIIPTQYIHDANLVNVMCNSFGFGGNDTTLIFSSMPQAQDGEEYHNRKTIVTAAKCSITEETQIQEIKNFLKPSQYRRMDYLLKSSLLASLKALQEANISTPDAIITATTYGCWENTELLLDSITSEGETMQKPTYFMQSTHNTISGNIAVFTNCRGYNTTYSHGTKSLESALYDAQMLLQSGKYKNVLVGIHDKPTAHLQKIMTDAGANNIPQQISMAMVLTTK